MVAVEIGAAGRPAKGESVSGDAWLVKEFPDGALVAVVDGLGHGPLAAEAARAVTDFLASQPWTDLAVLLKDCSAAVAHTRGAALALLHVDVSAMRLRHCGVGNVDVTAIGRQPARPVSLPGVVGARIRKVVETTHTLHAGDRLAVFTDGISSRFDLSQYRGASAQDTAEQILAQWSMSHDDATCVVLAI